MAWEGRILIAVAAGGAIGALLRYGTGVLVGRTAFPFATLTVNVVGSFLLALLLFHDQGPSGIGPTARAFFAVGLLGAFTTMSTFSYETIALYDKGRTTHALFSVAANVGLSLLAIVLGRGAAQLLPRVG